MMQVKLCDRAKERDVFYSIVRQLDSIENKAKPDVEISQIQVWYGMVWYCMDAYAILNIYFVYGMAFCLASFFFGFFLFPL